PVTNNPAVTENNPSVTENTKRATPPLRPSNPRTLLVLMVGATGGVIAGFGLGLLRDIWDQVFRSGCEYPAHGLHSDAAQGQRAGDLAVAPAKDRLWRLGASNHQAWSESVLGGY